MIRRLAEFGLKAAVLIIVLWYVLPKLDMHQLESALRQTSIGIAFIVIGLFLLQAFLAAIRWRWIVGAVGYRLSMTAVLDAWLVGQCASQVLPALVGGDAARILRLKGYGVPMSASTVTVIMDRFAGFVILLILSVVSIPVLTYRAVDHPVPHEIGWIVCVSALLLFVFGVCLRIAPKIPIMQTSPALQPIRQALNRLPTDPLSLLVLALTSVGTNMTVVVSALVLGQRINAGIDLSVCVGVLPLVTLLSFLPISIAGWGLREAIMVGMFSLVDIPPADALAVSIQLGVANLILGLVGGAVWLTIPARAPAEIGSDSA